MSISWKPDFKTWILTVSIMRIFLLQVICLLSYSLKLILFLTFFSVDSNPAMGNQTQVSVDSGIIYFSFLAHLSQLLLSL